MKIKDDSFVYAPLVPEERKKSPVRPVVTLVGCIFDWKCGSNGFKWQRFTLHGETEAYFTIETSAGKFTSLTLDALLPFYDDDKTEQATDLKTRFNDGERIASKVLDVTNCFVLPTLNMAKISFIQKEPPKVGGITADVFKNYWRFMVRRVSLPRIDCWLNGSMATIWRTNSWIKAGPQLRSSPSCHIPSVAWHPLPVSLSSKAALDLSRQRSLSTFCMICQMSPCHSTRMASQWVHYQIRAFSLNDY